jgi:hypothetical protein
LIDRLLSRAGLQEFTLVAVAGRATIPYDQGLPPSTRS